MRAASSDEAVALDQAGCFSIVLECVPSELAALITNAFRAGRSASGPVLV